MVLLLNKNCPISYRDARDQIIKSCHINIEVTALQCSPIYQPHLIMSLLSLTILRTRFDSNRAQNIGILMALSGIVLFSGKAVLIKLAYAYDISTVELMTLRMGFALPFYLVIGYFSWIKSTKRINIEHRQYLGIAIVGISGYYIASYLDMQSLRYISVNLERMVLFTYPAFTLILTALLYRKPLIKKEISALTVAYIGISVIMLHDSLTIVDTQSLLTGGLYVLAASFFFALFLMGSQHYARQVGSAAFTTIAMIAASIMMLGHFLLTHQIVDLIFPPRLYIIAITMAVLTTVIPSYLISSAISRIGASKASILGAAGPITTAMLAVFVLDEVFTLYHALGMALVISGVTMISRTSKPTAIDQA
jgi:drug/metabolite transporter (DMT)-like permease